MKRIRRTFSRQGICDINRRKKKFVALGADREREREREKEKERRRREK